ncbi:MAG: response regulator [Desulfosarcina sp.]|nr:response regulator [Desulfobacterales bacterium]
MPEESGRPGKASSPALPENVSILMVDDDPLNLKVLSETIKGLGYTLLAARSGNDALRIAAKAHPTVILLDIQMPGIDGYETCRRLKADESTRDIAIVFLTALQSTEDKVKGLSLGAVDFITKPFDPDEIMARVTRQVAVQQRHKELVRENRALALQLREAQAAEAVGMNTAEISLPQIIQRGENDRVEFKSTLRWNLKSDRAERVIEKAWLKTVVAFLNSSGGTLIVGVGDDGDIVGIAPDCFDNEDKYLLHVNNRLQSHVGLAHCAGIRYYLAAIADTRVLVIQCRPSSQPVFLKMGKEEEFFVRVGPGSRKLSTSEVVAYVTQRQIA